MRTHEGSAMTNNPNNVIADVDTDSRPANLLARRGRFLVVLGAVLFSISTAFPVVASLVEQERFPVWIGLLDVTLAFSLVLMTVVSATIGRGRVDDHARHASYRVYRLLANLPLVLLVVFFVFGEWIKWDVLLIGLAWRMWALLYILPAVLSIWGRHTSARSGSLQPQSLVRPDNVG
jgi:hypothetical protein